MTGSSSSSSSSTAAFVEPSSHLAPIVLSVGAAVAGVVCGRLSSELGFDDGPGRGRGGANACPKCNGAGTVPCMCTRWNFASAANAQRERGCERCSGTQKNRCPLCSGGGLKVHSKVPVRQEVPVRAYDDVRDAGRWFGR